MTRCGRKKLERLIWIHMKERKKRVNSWIQEFVDEAGRFLDSAQDLWRGRHSSRKWQEVATFFSEQLSIWKMLSSPTNPNSNEKGQWFLAGGDSRSIEKLNTNRSRCRNGLRTPLSTLHTSMSPGSSHTAIHQLHDAICSSQMHLYFLFVSHLHLYLFIWILSSLRPILLIAAAVLTAPWYSEGCLFVACLLQRRVKNISLGMLTADFSCVSLQLYWKIACWHGHPPLIRRQVSKWSIGSPSNNHWKTKGVHARKRFLWRMKYYLHLFFFLRARGNANCEHIANLRRYMLQASAIAWHRDEWVFLQRSWKRSIQLKESREGSDATLPKLVMGDAAGSLLDSTLGMGAAEITWAEAVFTGRRSQGRDEKAKHPKHLANSFLNETKQLACESCRLLSETCASCGISMEGTSASWPMACCIQQKKCTKNW